MEGVKILHCAFHKRKRSWHRPSTEDEHIKAYYVYVYSPDIDISTHTHTIQNSYIMLIVYTHIYYIVVHISYTYNILYMYYIYIYDIFIYLRICTCTTSTDQTEEPCRQDGYGLHIFLTEQNQNRRQHSVTCTGLLSAENWEQQWE